MVAVVFICYVSMLVCICNCVGTSPWIIPFDAVIYHYCRCCYFSVVFSCIFYTKQRSAYVPVEFVWFKAVLGGVIALFLTRCECLVVNIAFSLLCSPNMCVHVRMFIHVYGSIVAWVCAYLNKYHSKCCVFS